MFCCSASALSITIDFMLFTRFDKERCSVAFSGDPSFVTMTRVRINHDCHLLCLNDDLNICVSKFDLDDSRQLVFLACFDKDTQAAIVPPALFNLGLSRQAARDVKSALQIRKAGFEVAEFVSKSLAPEPRVFLQLRLKLLLQRGLLRLWPARWVRPGVASQLAI